jgi:hypothetical protein
MAQRVTVLPMIRDISKLAMQSSVLIFSRPQIFSYRRRLLSISQNVPIWATGAILTNTTLTKHFFQIDQCEFLRITRGKYMRSGVPSASWPTDRHCFYFLNYMDVVVQNIFIDDSPGMGIRIAKWHKLQNIRQHHQEDDTR